MHAPQHYGTSVGHAVARITVLDGADPGGRVMYPGAVAQTMNDSAKWKSKLYDPKAEPAIMAAIEEGS